MENCEQDFLQSCLLIYHSEGEMNIKHSTVTDEIML